jgi:hypothetical protein
MGIKGNSTQGSIQMEYFQGHLEQCVAIEYPLPRAFDSQLSPNHMIALLWLSWLKIASSILNQDEIFQQINLSVLRRSRSTLKSLSSLDQNCQSKFDEQYKSADHRHFVGSGIKINDGHYLRGERRIFKNPIPTQQLSALKVLRTFCDDDRRKAVRLWAKFSKMACYEESFTPSS